jgi:hypothetical protein
VVALMEKGGHARVHVRRSCGDFYMRCEQCVELHALASKIRRTNRGDLTSQGAQVADRRATWEGHNACVAGGDAWRNAAPEAWGRVRGVGKWHNIIGMRGPAVGGGGVPVAEVVQETHGGVRGTRTLEHDVAAQCQFKFI